MESFRHAAGRVDFRYLESFAESGGARHDSNCHRSLRTLLFPRSGERRMNRSTLVMALILAAAAITATAATSDSDMLRCAAIAARDARLDCYDALAHQLSNKGAASAAGQPATPPAPVSAAPAPASASAPTSASARAPASADSPAASQA